MNNTIANTNPAFNPKFVSKIPTAEQEFERVWYVVESREFFQRYGYKVVKPNHKFFEGLSSRPLSELTQYKDDARRIFVEEVYDSQFYLPAVKMVEACNKVLTHATPVLKRFHALWGFKLFSEYTVLLTRYGTSGSYFSDTGIIQIRYNEDGRLGKLDPASTLLHEVVHCGIEEDIVVKFKLTHPEKERLVDLIMKLSLEKVLDSSYELQTLGDDRIDKWVTRETIEALPPAIASFVAANPRQ